MAETRTRTGAPGRYVSGHCLPGRDGESHARCRGTYAAAKCRCTECDHHAQPPPAPVCETCRQPLPVRTEETR